MVKVLEKVKEMVKVLGMAMAKVRCLGLGEAEGMRAICMQAAE